MDNTNKFKKWRSFDFGPQVKNVTPNKKGSDSLKEINYCKKTNNRTKVLFNFHEKLAPTTISDLAVHPKKIQEVEEWFKWNVDTSETSILLITGPTGAGKTATVSVICKNSNISISEWVNPMDQEYEYREMNQVDQFIEFLSESKYSSLFENSSKRITLVKDFPNALIQKPDQFFEILEDCKYKTRQPVIFICTETSSSNLNIQRTLFPDEILKKFDITHISFNACAPSLMKIAFKRAQDLVKSNSDIFKKPSQAIIDAILASADGDIRNAMNQFQMASLLGSGNLPTTKMKSVKRKRSKDDLKLSFMIKDQNLGLFHGLGRVLNPKKSPVGDSWRFTHNIETLVDEFATQPQMFTSFLFENYLKYFGDINDITKASGILSESVRFLENWERHDTLIFALWVSVLGLMIYNEHKVSRWTQIRAPVRIKNIRYLRESENVRLDATDCFYYNVINKSDKFHRFKLNF